MPFFLAQSSGPDAATLFYLTLLFIFLTAIITTLVTKWSRDKCLKFFDGYHVTLERNRGQTTWGRLKVFPTGLEVVFDHPYVDHRGRRKTSFLVYQQEMDTQLLSLVRYHESLSPELQRRRELQIHRTFNPGPARRLWRALRNLVNTLRDAFGAAIGAAVGQFQKMNPTSAVLGSQGQQVTQIGQTLLGKFANAYEPLLEQYIGQPVILDVLDPLNPNNAIVSYTGYLADYTQQYVALFNVKHSSEQSLSVTLPDTEKGDRLPPLPAPAPPGAPAPVLPEPLSCEHELAIRLDGSRLRLQNTRPEPITVRSLERDLFEPVGLGVTLPPNATLELATRDARAARLLFDVTRCLDVVAPRKYAVVRHAGELVERRGLLDEFDIRQLPLIPKFRSGREQ